MTWTLVAVALVAWIGAAYWHLRILDRRDRDAEAEAARRQFREAQRRWQITHEHARRWR